MSERYKWTNPDLLGQPQSVTPGIPMALQASAGVPSKMQPPRKTSASKY